MDFTVGDGLLVLKHRLRGGNYKISKGDNFKTITIFKKPVLTGGFTSFTEDFYHVLLIDWDDTWKAVVKQEIKALSEDYGVFYLFKTKEYEEDGYVIGGYHGVCLVRFTREEVEKILRDRTSCDRRFVDMWSRSKFKSWVLRQAGKGGRGRPEFLEVIGAPYEQSLDEYENHLIPPIISSAHKVWLEKLYPEIPKIKYPKEDGLKTVFSNTYETSR